MERDRGHPERPDPTDECERGQTSRLKDAQGVHGGWRKPASQVQQSLQHQSPQD
jgi:hypothetical protein